MAGKDNQMSRLNKNKDNSKTSKTTKPKSKKKKGKGKRIAWALFFTAVIAIFCALAGYLFILISGEKLLEQNQDKLTAYGTSKVYDRNGTLMGELSIQKSDPVEYKDIPDLLVQAFIATEDKRFMEHNGVDMWSIGRAAVKDIMARSMVEGGSTITQQLAKNIFLTRDKTFFRKATEMSIALALERQHSKEEIIEMYLNRINFGGPYYGIKAASERYFGESDLNNLELWEMATLAAMPKGPSRYNPLKNPELSKERRAVVLTLMEQQGYITAGEAEEAKKVDYDYTPPERQQKYTAFIDYVMEEAEEKWGLTEDDVNIGGYQIYTTMDINAQQAVEEEFSNPANFEESPDDVPVEGSMVIINQETGGIVAMAGGREYTRGGFSRATDSRRQPGSALKPIVSYAPALESGNFTKDSRLSNKKQCFGGNYCPNNLHGYSETISMPEAIQRSENIPAVWLLNQIGVKTGFDFAQSLGIKMSEGDANLSLALGGMDTGTNTFEMAQAFSAFANGGEFKEAFAIKQIKDNKGKVVHENKGSKGKRVMEASTASQMTDMMRRVVDEGTGKNARISRPVAGKTGTTQSGYKGVSSNRDVWFVGYTPELTAAVWMGYDTPDRQHLLKRSSSISASLWGKVMEKAVQGYEAKNFPSTEPPPPPVEETTLTAVSGLTGSYNGETQTVSLSWNAVQGSNIQYHLYRKETSEAEYTRILDSLGGTSIEDVSAMEGLTYDYYVTAFDTSTGKESEPSNVLQVVAVSEELPPEEVEPPPVDTEEPPPVEDGDNGAGNEVPPGNENGNGTGPGDTGNGNGTGEGPGSGNGNGTNPPPDNGTGTGQDGQNPGNGSDGSGDGSNNGGSGTGGNNSDTGNVSTVPGTIVDPSDPANTQDAPQESP
ncbi:penicillin-binding protein, 1A family [Paenibacillus vortex V453]|uniref:Penicillin-binding protein, 1A family n=1 Tax=Paenibacillus vortex V453 TaxID=715225 RepID=A0A2R9SW16_9BACL|nr:PBP1A family penicillin-binding protein [Paenibacillus vortex]EFU41542.1 penicillin-binding protein, 1A family [Paenibacillus vortex V453]